MSRSSNSSPPTPQDYPVQPTPKPAVWKRKWVQITSASLVAFVVGLGAAGSAEPATAPTSSDTPAASSPPKTNPKTAAALVQAKGEADRLKAQVASLRTHEQAAVARVRAKARAHQRTAVKAAKAEVRALAQTQQKQAVAAAVSKAKASVASSNKP